jgi:hypothetical protein
MLEQLEIQGTLYDRVGAESTITRREIWLSVQIAASCGQVRQAACTRTSLAIWVTPELLLLGD